MKGLISVLFAVSGVIQAATWKPIDPNQVALKTPAVEKDADAEILLWDVRVEDKVSGQDVQVALQHYVRIKIFTEKGAKDLSSIHIPLSGKRNAIDVAARTIQPDGKISELQKDAIFQRELLRAGRNFRVKAKSFPMPNVTPGSIVEYQYREIRDDELSNYIQLRFSREYPIHSVTYHIKPLQIPWLPFSMRAYRHMLPEKPFVEERDGYSAITLTNVPAFKEEPDMPPENMVQPWLMVYYSDKDKKPEQYWKEQGKEQQRLLNRSSP